MDVLLGLRVVFYHLKGALQVLAVELICRVRKFENKGFVPVVLLHQLSVYGSLIQQLTLDMEFLVSSSGCYGDVLAGTPLFDQPFHCISGLSF